MKVSPQLLQLSHSGQYHSCLFV